MLDESEETGGASNVNAGRGAGLYERIMGDAWLGRDEPVRRLHTSVRVPLPRSLAPRVEARESGAGDREGVNVYVSASAPLVGPMLSYEGRLSVAADETFTRAGETFTKVEEI